MSKNKRVAIFVLAILLLPFCASAQEFLNLKKLSDRATKAELPLNTAEIVFVAQTNDLVITSSSPTYDRFSPPYRNKEGQYEYVGTIDINDGYPYRHFLVEKKGTGFTARTKEKLAFAQGDRLYMEVSEPEVKFILSQLTTRACHLVENECCVQISSPLPDLIVTAPEELGCKIESKHTNSGSFLTTIKVSTIVLDRLRAKYSGPDDAEELEKMTTLQVSFANSNVESVSVRDLAQRDKLQYNVLPFTSSAQVEGTGASAASQYVVFKVTPSEALVSLNGERLFVKDGVASKYVPQGRYEYTVECALYHSKSGTVTVGEKKETVEVTLVPAFGYISISGRTSNGATVYIDNQQVGSVPLSQYRLSSGTHTIEVVKDLYKPYRAEVQVAEGKTNQMELELEANFAQVELVAENGVSIYINGIYAGEGKVSEKLTYGSYEVETRKENHRSVKDVYEISSSSMNKTYKLALPEPIYGSVRVESVPAEAEVWVDGEKKDVTPCVLSLMIGHHEIMLQKQGFAKATRTVTIVENDVAEVSEELVQRSSVTITSEPTGATVYIDGKSYGVSPVNINLSPGTYTVKAEINGVSTSQHFTVSEEADGQSISLDIGKSVQFTSSPSRAKLYIDGSKVGYTPSSRFLTFGTHKIKMKKDGVTKKQNIQVSNVAQPSWDFYLSKPQKVPANRSKVEAGSLLITLNGAFSFKPQASFGFRIGTVNKWGWNLSMMSNFKFDAYSSAPLTVGVLYNFEQKSTSRLGVTVGPVWHPTRAFLMFLNAGYGYRSVCYTDDTWALYRYDANTYHGLELSWGMGFNMRRFVLSVEVVTINFKYSEFKIGLGGLFDI